MIEIIMSNGSAIKANNMQEMHECLELYKQMLDLAPEPVAANQRRKKEPALFEQYKHYALAFAEASNISKRNFARACVAGQIMMFNEHWQENAEIEREFVLFKSRDKQDIERALDWLIAKQGLKLIEEFASFLKDFMGYEEPVSLEEALDTNNWGYWIEAVKAFDSVEEPYMPKEQAIGKQSMLNLLKRKADYVTIKKAMTFCIARCDPRGQDPTDREFITTYDEHFDRLSQYDAVMKKYLKVIYASGVI